MTTLYSILHVPSGMYFCPSREVKIKLPDGSVYQQNGFHVKSNLSRTGKMYWKKPSLKYVGSVYYTHVISSVRELNGRAGNYCLMPVIESEWQIEEVPPRRV